MTEHKGIDLTMLASFLVAVNWQTFFSITVLILSGAYYATRLYKEWFCGESER